jgi:hypothetical protein
MYFTGSVRMHILACADFRLWHISELQLAEMIGGLPVKSGLSQDELMRSVHVVEISNLSKG